MCSSDLAEVPHVARAEGASLHMRDFRSQNLSAFIDHAPAAVDAWLEAVEEATADFRRRVRRSEGFHVALRGAAPTRSSARRDALARTLTDPFDHVRR